MQFYLLKSREQPTGQNCSHMMEGETCKVIIEISTKLMRSLQQQFIFQWVMQHSHWCLISIVYTDTGEQQCEAFGT